MQGLGIQLFIYWLVAVVAAWGAFRYRPRIKASALPIANGR